MSRRAKLQDARPSPGQALGCLGLDGGYPVWALASSGFLGFADQGQASFGTVCASRVFVGMLAAFLFAILAHRGTCVGECLGMCRFAGAQVGQSSTGRDDFLHRDRAVHQRGIACFERTDTMVKAGVSLANTALGGAYRRPLWVCVVAWATRVRPPPAIKAAPLAAAPRRNDLRAGAMPSDSEWVLEGN